MWKLPESLVLENNYVKMVPLCTEKHINELYNAACLENNNNEDIFRYMVSFGPFLTCESMKEYSNTIEKQSDRYTWVVFNKAHNRIVGSLSLVNINCTHGVLEIGSVWYNKVFQGTYTTVFSMFLIIQYVFETLNYRRIAWQCNNQNLKSRYFAESIGFKFEGTFRNHYWAKGENRDTDWLSLIIEDWDLSKILFEKKIKKLTTAST